MHAVDDILKGQWHQVRGKLKKLWGEITDDELDQIGGERERLAGKLQEHYGWSVERVNSEIDDFIEDIRTGV